MTGLPHSFSLLFCFGVVFMFRNYGLIDDYDQSTPQRGREADVPVSKGKDFVRVFHTIDEEDERLRPIFDADIYLYDVEKTKDVTEDEGYDQVVAWFCALDWTKQKESPQLSPRFSNVVADSWKKYCRKTEIDVPFAKLVEAVRQYDEKHPKKVHSLEVGGFIYHESRCGSTLTANMLTVAHPEAYRIYSEPSILHHAMKTGNKKFVDDVLYMMGRSNNPKEKMVFYKLRSTYTRKMDTMPEQVPWIFMYREPEAVLASHFNPTETAAVVCLQSYHTDNELEIKIAEEHGKEHKDLPPADICAIRLASIAQYAIQEHNRTNQGHFVNYNTLPNVIWEKVLPEYFEVNVDAGMKERMQEISGVYSKAGFSDSDIKWDKNAPVEKEKEIKKRQRKAAAKYMADQYDELERLAGNV
eukprot:CAMPEP_0194034170 /NCGR_PEP_ID=MMETSP0009_2-20130614/6574_1 /TAXON_ID=210454 /ORGANISM="Grammatophora oceanica, Strain CCMP 410" /LENGTH=412 /DNA_ID=CAMNT_0038674965 /DNA_START=64 /DNA_END=1302 /DNA_ORIENTATION=+